MSLGTKIRQYRVAANISQKELAEMYHVQRQTVIRWEADRIEPNIQILISMAFLFHVSLEDLVRDEIIAYKEKQADSMKDKMLKKQIARKGKYVNMIKRSTTKKDENEKQDNDYDEDDDYDDFIVDDDFDDGIDDDELIARDDFDDYKY